MTIFLKELITVDNEFKKLVTHCALIEAFQLVVLIIIKNCMIHNNNIKV